MWRPQLKFRPEDYAVEQVFYRSKDGTRIPMFLAHKRGLAANAAVPALLYGYGGFNISLPPRFSVGWLVWMEMGGLLAVPNLRGGGEYGEAWHRAGTKLQKQNVFDDFIAAAQWLIDHHYTRPDKLAIQGGSNGGLLVGAALTQRPELFGAALPAVGVMDMRRFHRFTRSIITGSSGNSRTSVGVLANLIFRGRGKYRMRRSVPPSAFIGKLEASTKDASFLKSKNFLRSAAVPPAPIRCISQIGYRNFSIPLKSKRSGSKMNTSPLSICCWRLLTIRAPRARFCVNSA